VSIDESQFLTILKWHELIFYTFIEPTLKMISEREKGNLSFTLDTHMKFCNFPTFFQSGQVYQAIFHKNDILPPELLTIHGILHGSVYTSAI